MIRIREERRGVKAGKCFGRLTVLGSCFAIHKGRSQQWFCVCECKCGTIKVFRVELLVVGNSTSCGCLFKDTAKKRAEEKHYRHPLYRVRADMIQRCCNPKIKCYKHYGGRGIVVCDEWLNDYQAFYEWAINNGWGHGLVIDRIDNNGNYAPSNCRFVTQTINARNTRANHVIDAFGERKTLVEWSEDKRCKTSHSSLIHRINEAHWDAEKAISTPKGKYRRCSKI